MQLFNGKTPGRSGKDSIITGNAAENTLGFAQGVQKPGDQLCCAWAGMNNHDRIVIVDIQHQVFSGLEVVGTPSSAGRQ